MFSSSIVLCSDGNCKRILKPDGAYFHRELRGGQLMSAPFNTEATYRPSYFTRSAFTTAASGVTLTVRQVV